MHCEITTHIIIISHDNVIKAGKQSSSVSVLVYRITNCSEYIKKSQSGNLNRSSFLR